MGIRRKARELALKVIFEMDFSKNSLDDIIFNLNKEHNPDNDIMSFMQGLMAAYDKNSSLVNKTIEGFSNNWKLNRMASVDRNILRLGVTEILYMNDIPKKVTINEYLEIAKKFGTEESSSFVNGILDKINVEQIPE